jgi:hypothetical protein
MCVPLSVCSDGSKMKISSFEHALDCQIRDGLRTATAERLRRPGCFQIGQRQVTNERIACIPLWSSYHERLGISNLRGLSCSSPLLDWGDLDLHRSAARRDLESFDAVGTQVQALNMGLSNSAILWPALDCQGYPNCRISPLSLDCVQDPLTSLA